LTRKHCDPLLKPVRREMAAVDPAG